MQVSVNGQPLETRCANLQALVEEQTVNNEQLKIAVAVNGAVIVRKHWAEYVLQPNDDIDVVQAVAGG